MINREKINQGGRILSWAMYDMANQFFALNIVSLYFVRWLTIEKKAPELLYSLAFGISTFFIALLAPILGTVADMHGKHSPFLIFFTLLCIVFTMLLALTNSVLTALLFFAIANIGCQEAVIFYNSLMLTISRKENRGLISGLGKMFGYLGAIIALLVTKPVIAAKGYGAIFLLSGGLFFIFALPCMIFIKDAHVPERRPQAAPLDGGEIVRIFKRLKTTLFTDDCYCGLREFLKAAFLGLCVIQAIMLFMSVYATKAFGLNDAQIINFIAFSTLFAVIGSLGSGILSDRIGYKRAMMIVFLLWMVCLVASALVVPPFHLIVGALAGVSLGATWVVARALVMNIVPRDKTGEAFGLFNFVGYLSGIIGPILWGVLLIILQPFGMLGQRLVLLCFLPFFLIGYLYLMRVPEPDVY
ncbi:MAG: MFS transporter [Candidatus Omnitrophica bacterium]|nr:MFS transporter [Candidatus Omnitrophota bacterium]MBU4479329.1 MFS transporter [Candidatus Omnitrophota bacterium]MCG2704231.1 MFS transporter [Candidatus Omnitrophota bacterium]